MNARKPKGLFINTRPAACSIHESGRMMYDTLRRSDRYALDYVEINADDDRISPEYDFYAFNYHHVGMAWFDLRKVDQFPGLKMTFVLEVAPGDPFVLCPPQHFDAYLPLDPTLRLPDRRVFPFPRPLDAPIALPPFLEPPIPVIGSFGFATPGKGFELVVDAVNREFDRAVVRLNIPGGTFADLGTRVLHRRPYVEVLEERCRKVAKPGVDIRISRDFLDKEGLIRWCAENTLNCFLYNRDQPGLSATTDQAITSGRPLAVSANPTFRHIHAYLEPYPRRSLRDSLTRSLPEVQAMQRDWAPEHFARRMEEVLAAHGLLAAPPEPVVLKALPPLPPDRPVVLLINHPQQQCGIHQYGRNLAGALARSSRYDVRYRECSSEAELRLALAEERPAVVVFNYYILTMPWLTPEIIRSLGLPTFGVFHEVTQAEADQLDGSFFDFHLAPDPTLEARNPRVFPIPRLIPTYVNLFPEPDIPTIGSFGFAFSDKGLGAIVDAVQREFDEAIIKLHLPANDLVASDIVHLLRDCAARVHKPGIQLMVNRKFLDRTRLLDFLAQNSLNLFLYDTHKDRGISSVIEHALAVQRPLAVNRCGMFRHIHSARPSLCLEDRSLREILADGIAPQVPFLQMWNESAFILALEQTFDRALGRAPATAPSQPEPRPVPSVPAEPQPESSMATLKQRSQMDQAREILRARGLSFTEPGEAVPGLGVIGDPLKSWDVLRTIEAIEARVPRSGAVLDLGAFSCEILPILHRLGYRQLAGIDLNPDIVRMPHASEIRYLTGDFHATGLPDASFDAITALSVIEHGFDGPRLLQEVGRLLKPGGVFIASVDYWPEKIPTEGKEIFGLTWRIFSEAELRQFFRDGGRYGLEARGALDFDGGERVVHYEDRDYTFGWFCLTKTGEASQRPVLWLAPEDAASAVASLPALARVVQGLGDRRVTVVCPEATRDLHAACPGLDRVLAYDLGQAHRNPAYLKALAERVTGFQADRLLSPGAPGQIVVEALAARSDAPERIGFGAAPAFTRLLPLKSPLVPEGERMMRLLQALGLPAADLAPACFLTPEDEGRVRQWVTLQGLDPQRTVFLLAGPAEDPRTPFHLGAALREPLADLGLQAVVLGPSEASEVAAHWMEDLGPAHLNACGQFAPRELAALLAHGRVAVGGEGPTLLLAAAMGRPHVVLAGGGAFGRFSPASKEAHLASLPLACYGCGWSCPYPEAYCVQRVPAETLREALHAALGPAGSRPRLFVPERPSPLADGPEPLDLAPLLNPAEVEFHPCAAPAGPSEALFGIAVFHALGDVLNLTPVARQLKADHPGCRVVWFTSEACAPLLAGNPYVDELVALPGTPKALDAELPRLQASRPWTRFLAPAPYLNYDKVPGGSLWDLYRAAPGLRWTEGLEPVLVLDPEEVRRAEAWWSNLPPGPRILVEWEFTSEQSRFDEAAAFEMAARLAGLDPLFVFSGRRLPDYFDRFAARHRAVACSEPFRLNAVFYNRCDAFVGVSSGLTALSGSTACRSNVPSVEYVRGEHWSSAGLGKHTERMYAFTPQRFSEALDRLRIRLLDLRWAPDTTPRRPPLERLADGRERVACPACGDTTARSSRDGEIVECATCALVYRRLRPAPAAEAQAPSPVGPGDAARRPDLLDPLFALGTVPADGLLVDVRCGRGDLLLEARARGLRPLGFESNAAAAAMARDAHGLEVRSEAFADTSLPEGSADVVVFHRSLERAPDPVAALERADFLLGGGGLLVVATPNFQGLGSEALRERWEGLDSPETVTFFTPRTLRERVLQAGFEILSCTTQAGPGDDARLLLLLQKLEPGATETRCQELRKMLEAVGRGEEIRLIARKRGSYQGRALPAELRIAPDSIRRILWVRTDALGDALLSASMLGPLAGRFPGARIAVVCQAKAAPIYEACPHVAEVFAYDRLRALQDPAHRQEVADRLAAFQADLALHSVFSREPLGDAWVAASKAPHRVGFQGDTHNMTPEQQRLLDGVYTVRVPFEAGMDLELDRHRAFLQALGLEAGDLRPTVWTTPEDEAFAQALFQREGLDSGTTLALFSGDQFDMRIWRGYTEALAPRVRDGRLRVLALGSEAEQALNQDQLDRLGPGHLNLCGQLTLRQAAAVLRRCRAAAGAETGLAHLARAVDTPCAVLLGGGHFGRFMPYDSGTAVACLPLDCFLCDWSCPFPRQHCVKDLAPEVFGAAVDAVLGPRADRIRIFAQADWTGGPGQPGGINLSAALDPARCELIPVSARPWSDPAAATRRLPDLPEAPRSTVFCAVWHQDPDRHALLARHQACLDAQTVPVERVYVFDGGDAPPPGLKGHIVVAQEPLSIYEAWNLALTLVRTPYVLNLNLDDRLARDAVARYEQALDEGADLVGGDWQICFDPAESDRTFYGAPLDSLPFLPDWPPVPGRPTRLGSGDGRRGTFGPACAWRMCLHGELGRYPWRFADGTLVRTVADALWWRRLQMAGKRMVRLPLIVGRYTSHPQQQAEFRNPGDVELAKYAQIGLADV